MRCQEASHPLALLESAWRSNEGNSLLTQADTRPGAVCPTCRRKAVGRHQVREPSDQYCLHSESQVERLTHLKCNQAYTRVLRTCPGLSRQQVEGSTAGLAPDQII